MLWHQCTQFRCFCKSKLIQYQLEPQETTTNSEDSIHLAAFSSYCSQEQLQVATLPKELNNANQTKQVLKQKAIQMESAKHMPWQLHWDKFSPVTQQHPVAKVNRVAHNYHLNKARGNRLPFPCTCTKPHPVHPRILSEIQEMKAASKIFKC